MVTHTGQEGLSILPDQQLHQVHSWSCLIFVELRDGAALFSFFHEEKGILKVKHLTIKLIFIVITLASIPTYYATRCTTRSTQSAGGSFLWYCTTLELYIYTFVSYFRVSFRPSIFHRWCEWLLLSCNLFTLPHVHTHSVVVLLWRVHVHNVDLVLVGSVTVYDLTTE